MNKYKFLLFYLVIASFLSTVGGYNFSFLNFSLTFLVLLVSLLFSENINRFFLKIKKAWLPIFLVFTLCIGNGILFLLTDSKDFYVLFIIQIVWGLLGVSAYAIKKIIFKDNTIFFKGISQWYTLFFILVLIERFINSINSLNINLDIFHLLIVILLWKGINMLLEYRGILNQEKI